MGNILPKLYGKRHRILLYGMKNAGKTHLLYRLKMGEVTTIILPNGCRVETVTRNNFIMTTVDNDNSDLVKFYYSNFYEDTIAIIYVVDSNDKERMTISKNELHKLLKEAALQDCVLLVLANKQDNPNALSAEETAKALQLNTIQQKNNIYGSYDGEGVHEGLEWLSEELKQQPNIDLKYTSICTKLTDLVAKGIGIFK